MPSLGNHEYLNSTDPTTQSNPYFDYFSANQAVGFKPPAALVPNPGLTKGKGYYSYDLGSWHIVVLNSNCDYVSCDSTSAQAAWLQNDLASHPAQCTLSYMHHPLYATGTGGLEPRVKPLWQILYDNGAEVILNGHDHRYERLARIDPNDTPDPNYGIRPLIAGTGGDPGSGTTATNEPNSQLKIYGTAGILRMDLSDTSYRWQFVAADGTANGAVMDSGTESCHGVPGSPDTTPPTVTVAPGKGASGVPIGSKVEATFSEAMDATTINGSTFTLTKPDGPDADTNPDAVPGTVAYDSTSNTATLSPSATLDYSTTYTATVKGGANGVKDAAGNPLSADEVWTFTTAAPPADTTPPNTTIVSGPSGTVKSRDATFTFSSTEPSNATFQTRLDGGTWEANSTATSKTYSSLANGTHTFDVKATDAAGNTDTTPASRSWKVRAR
jgi:hypothetical protein